MGYDGSLKFDTAINESGFNTGLKNLGNIAKGGLSLLGGAVAGVASAMGAGVTAAIHVGMSFESQMSKVQAITGATGAEMEVLAEKAREMGAKTKFSATESGQAFEYMAMAGWESGEMLNGIEGIMNLAAASGENLASTSDIVTDALTAFGLSADQSSHFADVLAAVSASANTNVGMLGETFKYVAPVAGALGFSVEDTAVAIGLMANSGIKAGQAGTALRAILSRLTSPTDEVAQAMSELGISLTNSDGSMKSLNEIMGDLRNGFAGLSEAEQASIAATLGGQEAMSGLLAIVTASDGDFNDLQSAINGATNELTGYSAAAEQAKIAQNNLEGQLTSMRSAAEALGIELYESIKSPLTEIAKTGTEAIRELTTAFQEGGADGLIEAGGKLIADLLTGIAGALPNVITMAVQVITSIIQSLSANTPQILVTGGQILLTLISGVAQLLPSLAELALSIIYTLVLGLATNAPQLLMQANQMFSDFCLQIQSRSPELLQRGAEIISNLLMGLLSNAPQIIQQVSNMMSTYLDTIWSILPNILQSGANIILNLLSGLVSNAPQIIAQAGTMLVNFIAAIASHLPEILQKGIEIIGQLLAGIIRETPNLIGKIPGIIADIGSAFLNKDWGSIGLNIIKGISSGIVSAAGNLVSAAIDAARDAVEAVKGWLGIASPSKLMRDEVGKYMALGMGIGFKKNVPTKEMEASLGESVTRMKVAAKSVTSRPLIQKTTGEVVTEVKGTTNNPLPTYPEFDYERIGEETAKAMEGMGVYLDKKPVGKIVAPVVNEEMGKMERRKT